MGRRKGLSKKYKQQRSQQNAQAINGEQPNNANPNAQQEKKNDNWGGPIIMKNEGFETYYKENGVVPAEEYDLFMEYMRKPLPTTFRVVKSGFFVDEILDRLEKEAKALPITSDGETIVPPTPIPWYDDRMGWHYDVSKKVLRKSPEFAKFHKFLQTHSEQGNICRQEAVSMIPVLFLDVKPNHFVLDMCAAPGSKTGQILEALRPGDGLESNGMVIANDADTDRCYLLVHQTSRLGSPSFLVTTQEAEKFPHSVGSYHFNFDRILCDVPCTGDGTLRKSPDLWKRWNPGMGIGQHRIQLNIARRGAKLLKVGGKLVYSTCSMNPHEDEAVVAELIRGSSGTLRLVDCSTQRPELKRCKGVSKWRVFVNPSPQNAKWYSSFEEVPEEKRKKITKSLFPPTEEEAKEFHLDRCMRFLPHLMNTGGFFVAILEKTGQTEHEILMRKKDDLVSEKEKTTETKEKVDEEMEKPEEVDPEQLQYLKEKEKKAEKSWTKQFGEDPIIPLSQIDGAKDSWKKIVDFYGIKDSFPFEQLIARTSTYKNIFMACKPIMEIVHANNDVKKIKSVNTGLRMFRLRKNTVSESLDPLYKLCEFRLCNEAVHYLLPHISDKRIVVCEREDVCTLLTHSSVHFAQFSAKAQEKMESMTPGCFILKLTEQGKESKKSDQIAVCAWKGKTACQLLVPKTEVDLLRMMFVPNLEILPNATASVSSAKCGSDDEVECCDDGDDGKKRKVEKEEKEKE